MERSTAIITDRSQESINLVKHKLTDLWPDLAICGEARNGPDSIRLVNRYHPKIAFLEVRIPELCGMEVARQISNHCHVVFISSHDHYAINAFEAGAVDYLLKPVQSKRFSITIERLKEKVAASSGTRTPGNMFSNQPDSPQARNAAGGFLKWIKVRDTNGIRLIDVDDVSYFNSRDRYTAVITRTNESYIRKPIRELAAELDPDRFWRIHRGTLVNAGCIERISQSSTGRGIVKLKQNSETLTISRRYLSLFRQM